MVVWVVGSRLRFRMVMGGFCLVMGSIMFMLWLVMVCGNR